MTYVELATSIFSMLDVIFTVSVDKESVIYNRLLYDATSILKCKKNNAFVNYIPIFLFKNAQILQIESIIINGIPNITIYEEFRCRKVKYFET